MTETENCQSSSDQSVIPPQVGLYESVSNVIQLENITPVTPPFTIETLLTSDQYLAHYSGLHHHNLETGGVICINF